MNYLTTHTIRCGFAPGVGNYKKGTIDTQPQVIEFTSSLPMVDGPLRVLRLLPPLKPYLLTLPLFAGISRVRALSPAWTGSHARETLISRTRLFLPHDIPPTKKSSTIKSLPTFAINISGNSPFGTPALMKNAERYVPVIDLFDTFTGKLGHGD